MNKHTERKQCKQCEVTIPVDRNLCCMCIPEQEREWTEVEEIMEELIDLNNQGDDWGDVGITRIIKKALTKAKEEAFEEGRIRGINDAREMLKATGFTLTTE